MPIGIVQDVDPVKGTISVRVQGSSGTRNLHRVRMMKDAKIPPYGVRVVCVKDGRNYYYLGTPEEITPAAEDERASEEHMPGDDWLGDPDGAHVMVRSGGMISAMVSEVVGFIANKATGIIQLMGKIISADTTYYHKLIRTQGMNTKVDTTIAGSPNGIPLSLEMVRAILDTSNGTLSIDLSAFTDIQARLNINPASGNVLGANIGIEANTPVGKATLSFNGQTGNITVSAPNTSDIKIEGARRVLVNSDGLDPLDRVLTARDKCWKTGAPHWQGSDKFYVGKGVV